MWKKLATNDEWIIGFSKPATFCCSWGPTFWDLNPFFLSQNAPVVTNQVHQVERLSVSYAYARKLEMHWAWECDEQQTKPWPLQSKNRCESSAAVELYTSIRGLSNTHPLAWIALQPASLSAHLYVSLALNSSLWLCHHGRHRETWQLSLALISRHRWSITRLILVSPFKLRSSLKHRYREAGSCGWLSVWLSHFQAHVFILTSMKAYCNPDKIIHLATSVSWSSLLIEWS